MAVTASSTNQRYDRTIQAWQFALLQYAITRDDDDRLAALAAASAIDKSAPQRSKDFCFFHRTSVELCEAIAHPRPDSRHLLLRHLERMSDGHLRRAFAAVLDLDHAGPHRATRGIRKPKRQDLWKGLISKSVARDL